jgi:hypothetical protein
MFTANKQAIMLRRLVVIVNRKMFILCWLSFDVHCKQTIHYVAQVSGYRESKDVYFVLVGYHLMLSANKQAIMLRRLVVIVNRKMFILCWLLFDVHCKQTIHMFCWLSFDVNCKQTSHYVAQVSGFRQSKDVYFVLVII